RLRPRAHGSTSPGVWRGLKKTGDIESPVRVSPYRPRARMPIPYQLIGGLHVNRYGLPDVRACSPRSEMDPWTDLVGNNNHALLSHRTDESLHRRIRAAHEPVKRDSGAPEACPPAWMSIDGSLAATHPRRLIHAPRAP